jgi:hypothetical protein
MFTESLSDPTAGQRAGRARLHPELPQPIVDPTDPRCGTPEPVGEALAAKRGDALALSEPPSRRQL